MSNFKNKEKAECIANSYDGDQISTEDIVTACMGMAAWKDEQINLILDAIDYAYLKTDGTYGDLALVVADKVEYLKSLRQTNL